MNAVSNLTGGSPRRASLAVAFAAVVVLLAAPLAAVAVNPWSGAPSGATEVAPADAFGLNVVEPSDKTAVPAAPVVMNKMGTERAVGEWNPTGGGKGGGGSPKR